MSISRNTPFRKILLVVLISFAMLASVTPLAQIRAATPPQVEGADEKPPQSSRLARYERLFAAWTSLTEAASQDDENANALPPLEKDKVVYLTFDDGPDPNWTPKVLEMLVRHGAQATFFVIGKSAKSNPDIILQMAQAGQMIGNHSYNHVALSLFGWSDFYLEIHDTDVAVREALAGQPGLEAQVASCIRPPYGEVNGNIWTHAYRMSYDVSMWSVDTMDWSGVAAETMLAHVLEKVKPGSIILMHDGGKERAETVKGLGLVLHELTLQGYAFPPLCTTEGQVIKYP